ncbi:MAG: hypothetical protein QM831_41090 [Kofleriaceae bacterium]
MKTILVLAIAVGIASAQPNNLAPSVPITEARPPAADPGSFLEEFGTPPQLALWGVQTYQSYEEFNRANQALIPFDATCIDTSSAGAPETPATCASFDPGVGARDPGQGGPCGECFTHAIRSVNQMRLNLERLRCYYVAFDRYEKAAISLGDTASGVHAVAGLSWQQARAEILAAFVHLQGTYDKKLADMMPELRKSLDALGKCEADYMHEPDWYQRFGFIYYTFMADRYKRQD